MKYSATKLTALSACAILVLTGCGALKQSATQTVTATATTTETTLSSPSAADSSNNSPSGKNPSTATDKSPASPSKDKIREEFQFGLAEAVLNSGLLADNFIHTPDSTQQGALEMGDMDAESIPGYVRTCPEGGKQYYASLKSRGLEFPASFLNKGMHKQEAKFESFGWKTGVMEMSSTGVGRFTATSPAGTTVGYLPTMNGSGSEISLIVETPCGSVK